MTSIYGNNKQDGDFIVNNGENAQKGDIIAVDSNGSYSLLQNTNINNNVLLIDNTQTLGMKWAPVPLPSGVVLGGENINTTGTGKFFIDVTPTGSMRFRALKSGNNKIIVTTDLINNNKVDITLQENLINHNSLLNYNVNEHRVINDVSTSSVDLWSASNIQNKLNLKSNISHVHDAADIQTGIFSNNRLNIGPVALQLSINGANMGNNEIVQTDASGRLSTVPINTGYNLALGNIAGTVSEGNHTHNNLTLTNFFIEDQPLTSLYQIQPGTLQNNTVLNLGDLVNNDFFMYENHTQTMTNKTIDTLNNIIINDNEILKTQINRMNKRLDTVINSALSNSIKEYSQTVSIYGSKLLNRSLQEDRSAELIGNVTAGGVLNSTNNFLSTDLNKFVFLYKFTTDNETWNGAYYQITAFNSVSSVTLSPIPPTLTDNRFYKISSIPYETVNTQNDLAAVNNINFISFDTYHLKNNIYYLCYNSSSVVDNVLIKYDLITNKANTYNLTGFKDDVIFSCLDPQSNILCFPRLATLFYKIDLKNNTVLNSYPNINNRKFRGGVQIDNFIYAVDETTGSLIKYDFEFNELAVFNVGINPISDITKGCCYDSINKIFTVCFQTSNEILFINLDHLLTNPTTAYNRYTLTGATKHGNNWFQSLLIRPAEIFICPNTCDQLIRVNISKLDNNLILGNNTLNNIFTHELFNYPHSNFGDPNTNQINEVVFNSLQYDGFNSLYLLPDSKRAPVLKFNISNKIFSKRFNVPNISTVKNSLFVIDRRYNRGIYYWSRNVGINIIKFDELADEFDDDKIMKKDIHITAEMFNSGRNMKLSYNGTTNNTFNLFHNAPINNDILRYSTPLNRYENFNNDHQNIHLKLPVLFTSSLTDINFMQLTCNYTGDYMIHYNINTYSSLKGGAYFSIYKNGVVLADSVQFVHVHNKFLKVPSTGRDHVSFSYKINCLASDILSIRYRVADPLDLLYIELRNMTIERV